MRLARDELAVMGASAVVNSGPVLETTVTLECEASVFESDDIVRDLGSDVVVVKDLVLGDHLPDEFIANIADDEIGIGEFLTKVCDDLLGELLTTLDIAVDDPLHNFVNLVADVDDAVDNGNNGSCIGESVAWTSNTSMQDRSRQDFLFSLFFGFDLWQRLNVTGLQAWKHNLNSANIANDIKCVSGSKTTFLNWRVVWQGKDERDHAHSSGSGE